MGGVGGGKEPHKKEGQDFLAPAVNRSQKKKNVGRRKLMHDNKQMQIHTHPANRCGTY